MRMAPGGESLTPARVTLLMELILFGAFVVVLGEDEG